MKPSIPPQAWALILLLVGANAYAHTQGGGASGFITGFAHPVSGLDHIVAMVAVGLWGAQLGLPAIYLLPLTFPLMMAMGGMLALVGMPVPGVEIGIAISGLVLGLAVALRWRATLPVAMVWVAFFAIFHGHAHGAERPDGQDALAYSVGFVIATGLLHAAGIGLGLANGRRAGQLIVRAGGASIAAMGGYFLWQALT